MPPYIPKRRRGASDEEYTPTASTKARSKTILSAKSAPPKTPSKTMQGLSVPSNSNAAKSPGTPEQKTAVNTRLSTLFDQGSFEGCPPASLAAFAEELGKLGSGTKVISESQKELIAGWQSTRTSIRKLAGMNHLFVSDAERNSFGPCPPIDRIEGILRGATKCELQNVCESDWNTRVHADVLKLAFNNDMYEEKLEWYSATHASIQPPSLLPKKSPRQTVDSKMVDFVVCLVGDAEMRNIAKKHRFEQSIFNHIYEDAWQPHVIAISINTKQSGEGDDTGLLQLGTWASAHLAKLDELIKKQGQTLSGLPFLPLILVQGHKWIFFAITQEEGNLPVLWGRKNLGSTSEAKTMYGLIAALQKLGEWCQGEYREWFRQNIVEGFLDQKDM